MATRMDDVEALSRVSGGENLNLMARMFSQYTRGAYQLDRWTQQYLYRNYGILKKLVNIAPNQMTFRWGNLQLGGKDGDADIRNDFERLTRLLPLETMYSRKRGLSTAFNLAQKSANKTGNAAILLDVEDGGELNEPINYGRLKRINRLFVLNRWSIQPLIVGSMYDQDFYRLGSLAATRMLPELRKTAFQSVHRSRLLWFRGEELDDEELMRTGGCDDSVFQSVLTSFFNYQDAVCGAKEMIRDFDIFVHSLEGLLDELANDGTGEYEKLLDQRIEANDNMRRVHRTQLVDKDKEAIAHSTRQVSGYSDLLSRVLDDFLANVELTPAELLGKYPEGMADTGKTEQQNANDRTSRYQAEKFYSNIMDFCEVFFRCKEGPTQGKVPDTYNFIFELLYPVTPPEQAELQLNYAQIDDINIRNQVYSGDDVAKSRYGGNEFQPNIIIDFKQREKDKKAAEAQQSQQDQPPEEDIDALLQGYQTDAADLPRLLPPPEVQAAAREGLKQYKQQNNKSGLALTPLAQKLSMGYPLEPHDIQALRLFFISPKHRKVAKQPPSEGVGMLMWLMMGGDVGDQWSGAIARELGRRSDAVRMDKPCGKGFIADKLTCHALSSGQQFVRDPSGKTEFQSAIYGIVSGKDKSSSPENARKREIILEDLEIENWDEAANHRSGAIRKYHQYGLTPEDVYNIGVYVGQYNDGNFDDIVWHKVNRALRNDGPEALTPANIEYAEGLTKALKKLPAFEGKTLRGTQMYQRFVPLNENEVQTKTPIHTLYRRIAVSQDLIDEWRSNAGTENHYIEKSFGSTTDDPYGVGSVTGGSNVELRIKYKAQGSQGRYIANEESEILFLPGTQFKITKFEDRPPHPEAGQYESSEKIIYQDYQWQKYSKNLKTGFLSNILNAITGTPKNRDEYYRKILEKKAPTLEKIAQAHQIHSRVFGYEHAFEWGTVKHFVYLEEQ